jgi:xylulokinase
MRLPACKSTRRQAWDQELVRLSGIPGYALPELVSGTDCVGTGRAIHKDWGNIPLISAVGDQAAAARAAGSHRPGVASLSLGTSGVVSVSHRQSPEERWDGAFHLFPSGHDDSFQIIGTIPALGGVFARLTRLLGSTLQELDAIAAKSAPGHYRAQFFPFLGGSGAPHPKHELRARLDGIGLEFDRKSVILFTLALLVPLCTRQPQIPLPESRLLPRIPGICQKSVRFCESSLGKPTNICIAHSTKQSS